MYSKYPALVRTCIRRPVMYNRTEEYIEKLEKEGNIFVLRPEMKPVSRLEKDYDKLMAFYDHGYEMMKESFRDSKLIWKSKEVCICICTNIRLRQNASQQMIKVTEMVREDIERSGVREGIAVIFSPHTTAGFTINENADPDVVHDMLCGL